MKSVQNVYRTHEFEKVKNYLLENYTNDDDNKNIQNPPSSIHIDPLLRILLYSK